MNSQKNWKRDGQGTTHVVILQMYHCIGSVLRKVSFFDKLFCIRYPYACVHESMYYIKYNWYNLFANVLFIIALLLIYICNIYVYTHIGFCFTLYAQKKYKIDSGNKH